jgi:hypothetical protein
MLVQPVGDTTIPPAPLEFAVPTPFPAALLTLACPVGDAPEFPARAEFCAGVPTEVPFVMLDQRRGAALLELPACAACVAPLPLPRPFP